MKYILTVIITFSVIIGGAFVKAPPEPKPKQEEGHGAYYQLTTEEFNEVCSVVMAESGGETYKGQQAVAQCILNACLIGKVRPIEAIKANGYTKKRPEPTESVKQAVMSVFTDGLRIVTDRTTLFYSPANMKNGVSKWHESQIYVCTIGGHRFFEERVAV